MPEQVKDPKAPQDQKAQDQPKPFQSKAEPPKPEQPKQEASKVPTNPTPSTSPLGHSISSGDVHASSTSPTPPISLTDHKHIDEPKPLVDKPKPAPVAEPLPELVAFQFDRDTTIVAQVLTRYDDNTVDLIAYTDHTGHFKTNISTPASEKVYEAVRPGSRHDAGTYFPLPEDYEGSAGERIVDHSIFRNKKVVKTVVQQREI